MAPVIEYDDVSKLLNDVPEPLRPSVPERIRLIARMFLLYPNGSGGVSRIPIPTCSKRFGFRATCNVTEPPVVTNGVVFAVSNRLGERGRHRHIRRSRAGDDI
jgi:hypothetical protein